MKTNSKVCSILIMGAILMPVLGVLSPQTTQGQGAPDRMTVAELNTDRIHQPPPTPYLPAKNAVLVPPAVPTRMRVAILSRPRFQSYANRVFVLLGDLNRRVLEQRIGLKLSMVNISKSNTTPPIKDVIFYRPKFLRAALLLAEMIPGEQIIRPMTEKKLKKSTVDVEVWVSKEAPNR